MDRQTRVAIGIAAVLVAGSATGGGILLANRDQQPVDTGGNGGVALTQTELKYRLLEQFKPLFFCDPDYYPVGSEEGERSGGTRWWAEVNQNGEEVTAIRTHTGLAGGNLTAPSILRVYREHKRLRAVLLEPRGERFFFKLNVGTETEGFQVSGTVKKDGAVTESFKQPTIVSCPICLGGGTRIDTPAGSVRVAGLREGMSVWTLDAAGRRVVGTVMKTIRRAVSVPHPMIQLTLADGRRLAASPGHPTGDGRTFASLVVGDVVDGARIVSVNVEQSAEPFTYDLLPSGPTGVYWADGVLIGSTLALSLAA